MCICIRLSSFIMCGMTKKGIIKCLFVLLSGAHRIIVLTVVTLGANISSVRIRAGVCYCWLGVLDASLKIEVRKGVSIRVYSDHGPPHYWRLDMYV